MIALASLRRRTVRSIVSTRLRIRGFADREDGLGSCVRNGWCGGCDYGVFVVCLVVVGG